MVSGMFGNSLTAQLGQNQVKEAPASATANITGYLSHDEAVTKKKEAKPKEKKTKKVEKMQEVNSSSGSNSTSPPESS